ncbi:MAG TPA: ATP-binding cassette domain-containing protein, partial [Leucothrix mucor]|nr:ATP-binding cassette domain-containing protein [Leucothrix mucor]
AWVPQRPYLFHGSIADNIRLGNPKASDQAMQQAAMEANCADFIQALPQGYNTFIGERGEGLSGGQIQRIALARAFLKDAPLLILDEASANLDQQSEALIQQSIETLSQNRTVITIAHRLNTIKSSDLIVVLAKGKVVETGTHSVLLANNQHYKTMLDSFKATQ